jgi:hypothetical protein
MLSIPYCYINLAAIVDYNSNSCKAQILFKEFLRKLLLKEAKPRAPEEILAVDATTIINNKYLTPIQLNIKPHPHSCYLMYHVQFSMKTYKP